VFGLVRWGFQKTLAFEVLSGWRKKGLGESVSMNRMQGRNSQLRLGKGRRTLSTGSQCIPSTAPWSSFKEKEGRSEKNKQDWRQIQRKNGKNGRLVGV